MNSEPFASSFWVADSHVVSPLIYSEEYESFLFDYCLKNEISIVIPLLDIELPVLSKLKERFLKNGIRIIVADEWFTKIANDKWETNLFLKRNNFNVHPCFLNLDEFKKQNIRDAFEFPFYIKPRWGMASLSVFKAHDLEELHVFYKTAKREISNSFLKYESQFDLENSVLIQTQLPGEEFGLDIINDLNGNYCNTLVKKKVKMRGGETDIATIADIAILKNLGKELSEITKHPGIMDVDVFLDGSNAFILDINPRFGGGYPFIHTAGVNLPKAIVNWHLGYQVDSEWLNCKSGETIVKGFKMIKAGFN